MNFYENGRKLTYLLASSLAPNFKTHIMTASPTLWNEYWKNNESYKLFQLIKAEFHKNTTESKSRTAWQQHKQVNNGVSTELSVYLAQLDELILSANAIRCAKNLSAISESDKIDQVLENIDINRYPQTYRDINIGIKHLHYLKHSKQL